MVCTWQHRVRSHSMVSCKTVVTNNKTNRIFNLWKNRPRRFGRREKKQNSMEIPPLLLCEYILHFIFYYYFYLYYPFLYCFIEYYLAVSYVYFELFYLKYILLFKKKRKNVVLTCSALKYPFCHWKSYITSIMYMRVLSNVSSLLLTLVGWVVIVRPHWESICFLYPVFERQPAALSIRMQRSSVWISRK